MMEKMEKMEIRTTELKMSETEMLETEILRIDPDRIDEAEVQEKIKRAGALIASGQLVAFPTETVYGLGGDALDPRASARIYAAKGRPSDNPLIVHIAEIDDLYRVARRVPPEALLLAERFWPGPLTMILYKAPEVPDATTGGMDTVAIRMPDHPVALALIRESGRLIAGPSANTSGRPSPTKAEHVYEDLQGKIPMILDGGPVAIGLESSIIDLTEEVPMVLRPGYITVEMFSEALGREVVLDPGIIAADDVRKPKAPGMKYRHYAPKAQMIIVDGPREAVAAEINRRILAQQEKGLKTAVIATEETRDCYRADHVLTCGCRSDEDSIARNLFDILRTCDELQVDAIYSESFSTPRIGQAIMNRLLKAAGHQVISVG